MFALELLLENPDINRGAWISQSLFGKMYVCVCVCAYMHALVPLPWPEGPAGRFGLAAAVYMRYLILKIPLRKKKERES